VASFIGVVLHEGPLFRGSAAHDPANANPTARKSLRIGGIFGSNEADISQITWGKTCQFEFVCVAFALGLVAALLL
jgi:hypothetical protein